MDKLKILEEHISVGVRIKFFPRNLVRSIHFWLSAFCQMFDKLEIKPIANFFIMATLFLNSPLVMFELFIY